MRYQVFVSIISLTYALDSQKFTLSTSAQQVSCCWARTDAIFPFENCDKLGARKNNLCKVGSRRIAGINRIISVSEIQKQSRMRRILTGFPPFFFLFIFLFLTAMFPGKVGDQRETPLARQLRQDAEKKAKDLESYGSQDDITEDIWERVPILDTLKISRSSSFPTAHVPGTTPDTPNTARPRTHSPAISRGRASDCSRSHHSTTHWSKRGQPPGSPGHPRARRAGRQARAGRGRGSRGRGLRGRGL